MNEFPKLTTTPIREIIFTISYSDNISFERLTSFGLQDTISNKFNLVSNGFTANIDTQSNQGEPKATMSKDGLVFKNKKDNKVIQTRQGSFSFHKIDEYEGFDNLLSEFIEYWNAFLKCLDTTALNLTTLSLRYLNLIELSDGEVFSQISNIKAINPFVDEIDKYLIRLEFSNPNYKDILVGLVQAPVKRNEKVGLMLDINLTKNLRVDANNDLLIEHLNTMRFIKNDVFFKSVTNLTLNKYR